MPPEEGKGRKGVFVLSGSAPTESPQRPKDDGRAPSSPEGTASREGTVSPEGPAKRVSPRLWPLFVVLAAQGAFLAIVMLITSSYAPPAQWIPVDALSLPGGEARLGLRFQHEGGNRLAQSLNGSRVTLRLSEAAAAKWGGTLQSPSIAIDGGLAMTKLKAPHSAGTFRLQATLEGADPALVRASTANVVLQVVPENATLVIVKIPDVLQSAWQGATDGAASLKALSSAAEALGDLHRFGAVAYFASRRWRNAPRLRERLTNWRLPEGAILGVPTEAGAPTLHDAVKQLGLDRWKGPRWAILSEPTEAFHFTYVRFRVVLLGGHGGSAVDERSIFSAASWSEARSKILKNSRD